MRAGGARQRGVPGGHRLLHRAVAAGPVGPHIPRGQGEHDEGEHAPEVGRGAHDLRVAGAAARRAHLAHGHGRRAAQHTAIYS